MNDLATKMSNLFRKIRFERFRNISSTNLFLVSIGLLVISFLAHQYRVGTFPWLWQREALINIQSEAGFAYIAFTNHPGLSSHEEASPARVLENGRPLESGNALHDLIRQEGQGRYSFWHDYVYFSTSDNSDPRTNGRTYEIWFPIISSTLARSLYTVALVLFLLTVIRVAYKSVKFQISKPKIIAQILLVNFFGIILALMLLEIFLRLSKAVEFHLWQHFIPSPELGWVLPGNLDIETNNLGPQNTVIRLKTNSLGLRDVPEPSNIPANTMVIAIQGDSNVFGFGMQPEQTLSYQLQQDLNNRQVCLTENKCKVLNFGVSGYDINQYIILADKLSHYYKVDSTILVFNINDFASILINTYLYTRPYFRPLADDLYLVYPPVPLNEQSYAYQFIPEYAEYDHFIEPLNQGRFVINSDSILSYSRLYLQLSKSLHNLGYLQEKPYSKNEVTLANFFSPYGISQGTWQFVEPTPEPYLSYEKVVVKMLSKWAGSVSKPYLVILPDRSFLCSDMQAEHLAIAANLQVGPLDFDLFEKRMIRLAKEANIPIIDPIPEFKLTSQACSNLFIPDDGHLNSAGHKLLARIIANTLEDQKVTRFYSGSSPNRDYRSTP